MSQQTRLNMAGVIGAGLVAGQAHGVMVERPELSQILSVTGSGVPGLIERNSIAVDFLPDNPANQPFVVSLTLDGDLLTEDSKQSSSFGLSLMLAKLVEPNTTGLGSSILLSLLSGGDVASLPLNSGSSSIVSALGRLTPGQKQFVVVGFDNGAGETLHGYFGVSYNRVEQTNGEVTAELVLSDFAYDDDPSASSLLVVPEPASLGALAAGLLLAGGRRRSA
ncbi:MAG: PEP-CTERM sorting domain-containing protein [Phycisphaeraceae bacterium]